ncbi:MAG TPA: NAD-dependent epimerase/dehydratase family protein [Chloroflexia bacterium]|jgi:nucleoside-diphosphate-sugar epimerase
MAVALVTGATGMLGGQVAQKLVAAGYEVRVLVRPSSDLRPLNGLPVQVVVSGAGEREVIREAVNGCRWVFHAAASFHLGSAFTRTEELGRYKPASIDLTETLMEAGLESGVERFVHVSTIGVYGLQAPSPLTEDSLLDPLSAYGQTKIAAEQLVRRYQQKGLPTTIVRPAIMYGPHDRHFFPAALRLVRMPLLPLINGGRNLYDLAYAGDVADLMLQAAGSERASGKTYNSGSGNPLAFRAYLKELGRQLGVTPRICSIPPILLARFTGVARRYLKMFAPGVDTMMTPTGLAYLARDVYYDMSRAKEELGYVPRVSFREGVSTTLPYFGAAASRAVR